MLRTSGRRRTPAMVAAALLLTVLSSCSGDGPRPADHASRPADEVVVASFNFPESELVAAIYAGALEQAGIPVRRELNLGPRELVQPALQGGLIDVVPEYAGTALASLSGAAQEPPEAGQPKTAEVVQKLTEALRPWRAQALEPASAQNQNGLAVSRATAERLGLRTVSDLRAHAPSLRLTGPGECPRRPYCLQGLERVYGLQFGGFVAFDSESQRVAALQQGLVDVAVMFTTDALLAGTDPVLLEDDRGLQPVENIVPVVSSRAVERYGATLTTTLNAVSRSLTTSGVAFLNWRAVVAGKDIAAEARAWLVRHDLAARAK